MDVTKHNFVMAASEISEPVLHPEEPELKKEEWVLNPYQNCFVDTLRHIEN